jgi:dTDP-4-dehydrorhamnose reductase
MKFKRALITGCGGMLGSAVYPATLGRCETVLATDKLVSESWLEELNVCDTPKLTRVFEEYGPDLVLHLAAETDLEFCETHQDVAVNTNALATRTIAVLSERIGATLIYISTAGVFDGKKEGFYTEEDQPKPLMVYGRTKYQGEIYAQEHCHRTFVVRAGWMMGGGVRKDKKFVHKILKQLGNGGGKIHAVTDKWGTPTYTYDFALNLLLLVQTTEYGIYHMVCGGDGTRYDVAREILNVCNRADVELVPVSSEFFKEEYYAPRPASEMMINANLRALGLNKMRRWDVSLREYIHSSFADYVAPADIEPVRQEPAIRRVDFRRIVAEAGEDRSSISEQGEVGSQKSAI